MVTRSLLLFLLSLSLLFFLSLSIFSSRTTSQENYPPEYVEEYVQECTGGQDFEVEAICRCVVRKAKNEYSFAEFQEINQESKITGVIPQQLLRIITNCENDPFS